MTLQQLKYVVTVAETGTITEAANRLYISQPSLTNAIRELEKEMKITIFLRTNKGIILSKEGEDFLGYARQVLEQAAILEDKYKGTSGGKKKFCVSTQHYSFAVNAFVDLIKIRQQHIPPKIELIKGFMVIPTVHLVQFGHQFDSVTTTNFRNLLHQIIDRSKFRLPDWSQSNFGEGIGKEELCTPTGEQQG